MPSANLQMMNKQDLTKLQQLTTPKMTKYFPWTPSPKQTAFLLLDNLEAFYGGAVGGGKSVALLGAALQYVDIPGYNALLLRRTYSDLVLPGALLDLAKEILSPWIWKKEVHFLEKEKRFMFPSGANLVFGYLDSEQDKYRYQSSAFHFIGFDELTQFTETQYTYLFSRIRRRSDSGIPPRMRSASNPDGNLEWVKQRFVVEGPSKGRIFIPAKLEDNPHLDQESYEESLAELDPVTRLRLREGNWEIKEEGTLFKRDWFQTLQEHQLPEYMRTLRYWDFAASEDPNKPGRTSKGKDPDYTVGLLLGEYRGIYYVLDVKRFRLNPEATELKVQQTAMEDGYTTSIYFEEEPGSAGKHMIDYYAREILKGYPVRGNRETGSKVLRANPVSAAAERGNIKILEAPWNGDFLDELALFPTKGCHDDQIDALSGAFRMLKLAVNLEAVPTEVGVGSSYWRNIM